MSRIACQDDTHRQHGKQRGKDAADAALVETGKREASLRHLAEDQRGDQVAGDDEEDVDADEAARDLAYARMEQYHRDHRDGPEPVDIGSMTQLPVPPEEVAHSYDIRWFT